MSPEVWSLSGRAVSAIPLLTGTPESPPGGRRNSPEVQNIVQRSESYKCSTVKKRRKD